MSKIDLHLLLSVAAIYIIQCPFNKVEESFNTQAIHDIVNIFPNRIPLFYQTDVNSTTQNIAIRSQLQWDHVQFPGVVPRTFIGALFIGLPLKLVKIALSPIFIQKDNHGNGEPDFTFQFVLQLGARFALSGLVISSLAVLSRAIQRRYGTAYRVYFVVITVSQFHYLFYSGRFIPNTYAAILSNLFFATWINRHYSLAIVYIAICAAIFRFDTALFFGILLLDSIFIRRFLSLSKTIQIGIPFGLIAVAITFMLDSILWGRAVWPELESFYFNAWLNRSHEWGIQPYVYYIYSCIPRMMLFSTPLLFSAEHKFSREYLIPVIVFILVYSFLPHKELRFILFINPLLNLCAASGLVNIQYQIYETINWLSNLRSNSTPASKSPRKTKKSDGTKKPKLDTKPPERKFLPLLLVSILVLIMVIANLFCCFIMTRVSSHNYPGGKVAVSLGMTEELLEKAQETVENFNSLSVDTGSDVGIYVNNLAAQSGFSRFVHVNGAYYSKAIELDESTFKSQYKLIYLVLEPKEIKMLDNFCSSDESYRDNYIKNCRLPNQPMMTCSIVETVNGLDSVNIGAILRKAKMLDSLNAIKDLFDDRTFIRTSAALHIVRCINDN